MAWSKNNNAHTTLWAIVRYDHKDFIDSNGFVKFVDGGDWDNSFVIRSAGGDSPQMVSGKATAYATKLDEMMKAIFGAKYEDGIEPAAAIAAVAAALASPGSKLKDVGDPVDQNYLFMGEVE